MRTTWNINPCTKVELSDIIRLFNKATNITVMFEFIGVKAKSTNEIRFPSARNKVIRRDS